MDAGVEQAKRVVGEKAAELVEDGMIVGVGSGSTVRYFIEALARRVREGLDVTCVPTSLDTLLRLRELGLRVVPTTIVDRVDIAVDGADSILTRNRVAIKGGGGALFLEKVVDYAAKELVLIVDLGKLDRHFPVPVDVHPSALALVMRRLQELGGKPRFRDVRGKLPPCISDVGGVIIDVDFPLDVITRDLELKIKAVPGVLEVGIFSRPATVLVGHPDGRVTQFQL